MATCHSPCSAAKFMTLRRRHSCRTEGVEGACVHLLFWLWRSHPVLDSPQADGVQDAERNKALEAVRLQRGTGKPPVAVAGTLAVVNACRWSRSHPTRFVAGVGIFRRTSAHKRSPLFHRRAPGENTVVPEGSPGISRTRRQETLRAGRRECRSAGRVTGRAGKHLQSSRRRESQERDMPLQKAGTCLGRP